MVDKSIDLTLINKLSYDLILKHLCQNESSKNLVLTKDLSKILDGIIKFSKLKEHGVNKVFYLDVIIPKEASDKNMEWIYIIRPNVTDMQLICKQIKHDLSKNLLSKYPYKILFSPRKLHMCEVLFEQQGVYDYVTLAELENDLVNFDIDLVSMELPKFFSNYFLSGDQSYFASIAKALINIQDWFGKIPNVHMIGQLSKNLYELTNRLASLSADDLNSSGGHQNDTRIGHLILFDRSVDMVTPFCSPLTYESLLDEAFQINAGLIDIPTSDPLKTKRVRLSNEDKIFEEIRTMHISEVFAHLKYNIIPAMKDTQEKSTDLSNLNEYKEFVSSDLKDYRIKRDLVNLHMGVSEIIISQKTHIELPNYLGVEHNILRRKEYRRSFEYIEELINRKFNMHQVLRLMILLSRTNDGLSTGDYNQLLTQFLHTYGNEKIFLLNKLKRVGLFETESSKDDIIIRPSFLKSQQVSKSRGASYATLAKKLDAIPGELSGNAIKSTSVDVDLSYAFNGHYRPISCKCVAQLTSAADSATNREHAVEEMIKILGNGDYEFKSRRSESVRSRVANGNECDKTWLIVFLGGCTYTEIAVLKKLALKKNQKFLFATTSFFNAVTLINLFDE